MSTFAGLYDVRDAKNEDKEFIMATYLRGMYYGNTGWDAWINLIPKDIFMANYKKVIVALLLSPKVTIKIACLKEDPDVILGYSILSSDYQTVHYCFVKSAWRRRGIAKTLTPSHPTAVTHLTKVGKSLLNKFPGVIFDPFRL